MASEAQLPSSSTTTLKNYFWKQWFSRIHRKSNRPRAVAVDGRSDSDLPRASNSTIHQDSNSDTNNISRQVYTARVGSNGSIGDTLHLGTDIDDFPSDFPSPASPSTEAEMNDAVNAILNNTEFMKKQQASNFASNQTTATNQ